MGGADAPFHLFLSFLKSPNSCSPCQMQQGPQGQLWTESQAGERGGGRQEGIRWVGKGNSPPLSGISPLLTEAGDS